MACHKTLLEADSKCKYEDMSNEVVERWKEISSYLRDEYVTCLQRKAAVISELKEMSLTTNDGK